MRTRELITPVGKVEDGYPAHRRFIEARPVGEAGAVPEIVSDLRASSSVCVLRGLGVATAREVLRVMGFDRQDERASRFHFATYERQISRLQETYANRLRSSVEQVQPIENVEQLLIDGWTMTAASWKVYRLAWIWHLQQCRLRNIDAGADTAALDIALAVLLVFHRRLDPTRDEGKKPRKPLPTPEEIDTLMHYLASNDSPARNIALATLMTGLRPSDWTQVELEPISTNEAAGLDERYSWWRLDLPGTYCADTILPVYLRNTDDLDAVLDCRDIMRSLAAEEMDQLSAIKARDTYAKRMASQLRYACSKLWPAEPCRCISLDDLRMFARKHLSSLSLEQSWLAQE